MADKTKLPRARVIKKTSVTDHLIILRLKPEGFRFAFRPGQYCTIGIDGIERPYSIASRPQEPYIELFIRLVDDGEFTPKLWNLKVDDTVSLRPKAKGVFTFEEEHKNQVMISTVTGLAPFMSMIQFFLPTSLPGAHKFFVFQGASFWDELMNSYGRELARLAGVYPNFNFVPTVSRPNDPRNHGWNGEKGRVNEITLPLLTRFDVPPEDALVYLCGNPEMIKDLKERLEPRRYTIKEEKYW